MVVNIGGSAVELKIAAVVVTYNRKELVVKNIEATLFQTCCVDKIFVVNNNSSDGTEEYVYEKFKGNDVVEVLTLEENIGGAGGFSEGLKHAIECGYDYVFLMDDDGRPRNDTCLEKLLKSISVEDLGSSMMINSLVLNDAENLTFGLGRDYKYSDVISKAIYGKIVDFINPFNGTLVSRQLVEKIGYPNREFFIKGDEVDYYSRAMAANAIVYTSVDSQYYHPAPGNMHQKKVFGKTMYAYFETPLKEYYNIRNRTYSLRQLGKKKEGFKYLIKNMVRILFVKCKKIKIWKSMIKGYLHGKKGKLGKVNFEL